MRCKAVRSWVVTLAAGAAGARRVRQRRVHDHDVGGHHGRPASAATTAAPTTAAAATTSATGAATTTAAPASTPANGFAPVTISHQYGATTVDERPERIVSLDTQWTDVLLALDEMPVGYLGDPNAPDGFPWRGDMLATSTEIDAGNTLPFEQIAALQPDLIVITYLATDEGIYQKLSGIAPTITTLSGAVVDPWPDIALAAGQLLGEQEAAATLTDTVEADIAAVADAIPGLEGKTFTFFNVVVGDGIYVLTDPDDGANQLFSDLGLVVAPAVAALGTDVEGGRGPAQLRADRPARRRPDGVPRQRRRRRHGHPRVRRLPGGAGGRRGGAVVRGHRRAEHPEPAVDPLLAGEDPPGAGGRGRLTGATGDGR